MPFISKARNFLIKPGSLKVHAYYAIMKDTVDYLLNNAVGIDNAKSTDDIIAHLRHKGHQISRSTWQINVLCCLRDNGVSIAAKPGTGIFIIKTVNDAQQAVMSMEYRINVEKKRLQILKKTAHNAGWKL